MTNSFFAVIMRRRIVLIASFAVALVALPFILLSIKPTYIGTSHVMLVGSGSIVPSTDIGTLTTSETVAERVARRLNLGTDIGAVRLRVEAKVAPRSNVMPISFRDKNRIVARDAANAFAEETVNYYKELSSGQYDQMIAFLTSAAEADKERIRTIDIALQQAAQHDIYVGSDAALETITGRIGDLETQRATAYATLVSDEAIAAAQSAQPKEIGGIVRQEVLRSDPYVQALRAGQARDAAQLEFQRAQYTDRYPGLPGLQDQVQHESTVLSAAESAAVSGSPSSSTAYATSVLAKRSAMAIAAGDRARVQAIDEQIAAAEAHLKDLPGTGSEVSVYRVERDGAKASYEAMVARLADTRANQAAASSLGALVVIDRAIDAGPRLPRIAVELIVAFILLALIVGVAYLFEVLDQGLRRPEVIERLYGIPIIGNLGSPR